MNDPAAPPAEPPPAAGAVRERLERAGVRLVVMTLVDNGGVTRVKAIPLRRLETVVANGVGMSDVWAVAGVDDHFATVAPFDTPSGDMRLIPDLAAARPLHAAPGWAWAPADQFTQELERVAVCQRAALGRAAARATEAGVEVRMAYELEMTLLHPDASPAHQGPGYSTRALLELGPFALALFDALEAQGVDVDQLHAEFAPGQFEVSIAPSDPVAAADRLVLAKLTAHQVAHAHGLRVSFAPVVLPGEVGNGCHLHLSGWRDGRNLMQGGDEQGALTADGAAATGGILEALPGILAVLAPSVAAYGRLQPHHWAGAYACWGVENREAALRLIPGTVTSRARSANLEVKAVDGSANPYLAAAVILGAALDGLERPALLPDPVQGDPGSLSEDERAALGIARLPTNLAEATEQLAGSAAARAALGPELLDVFVAVRRMEWANFGALVDEPERLAEVYRWRY